MRWSIKWSLVLQDGNHLVATRWLLVIHSQNDLVAIEWSLVAQSQNNLVAIKSPSEKKTWWPPSSPWQSKIETT